MAMSSQSRTAVENIVVKFDGQALDETFNSALLSLEVENSLLYPNMATLVYHNLSSALDETPLIENSKVGYNKQVEIQMAAPDPQVPSSRTPSTVFKGEIVSIEATYYDDESSTLTIRAFDKRHRLAIGTKERVFVNKKYSDIVSTIAGEAGLTGDVEATSEVYKHVWQPNVSSLAFIEWMAQRVGYYVYVRDNNLQFKKFPGSGSEVRLKRGENLRYFHTTAHASATPGTVVVESWNTTEKQKTTGSVNLTPGGGATTSLFTDTKNSAARDFGTHKQHVHAAAMTQSAAQKYAESIVTNYASRLVTAEGETIGNAEIQPLTKLNISKLSTKLDGKYIVTTAIHRYDPQNGYRTEFRCEGMKPISLDTLVASRTTTSFNGVYVAIVSDIKESEVISGIPIVKVKFPWLSDTMESFEVRVAAPGLGNRRGLEILPEVNDEVLVAFENGDINAPYILGGLHNGVDKPHLAFGDYVADGKVVIRELRSTAGHVFKMEEKSGKEQIYLADAKNQNIIILDQANKAYQVKTEGKMMQEAGQNITITSKSGAIESKASTGYKVDASTVENKASASYKIEAATIEIKATGSLTIQSSGVLTLKGSVVQIN